MNASSSANATMSSKTRSVSLRERPRNEALRYTFSRPVRSGWNPAPSSRRGASRPRYRMVPAVGRRIPAMHFSSVVFPDPFGPIKPIEDPCAMSNETSRSAHNSSDRDRDTSSRCLREVGRSRKSRNIFEIPSIWIATVIAPPRSRRSAGRTSATPDTGATSRPRALRGGLRSMPPGSSAGGSGPRRRRDGRSSTRPAGTRAR